MKPSVANDYLADHSYFVSRALFRGIIDRYISVDTFSTWTLGATGLAAGFLFSNFEKLSTILKPWALAWTIGLLALSAAMGLVQKHFALRVESFSKVDDQVTAQLLAAFNSLAIRAGFENKIRIDVAVPIEFQLPQPTCETIYKQRAEILEIALTEFQNGSPWPMRGRIRKARIASQKDVLFGIKQATRWFLRQSQALAFQLIALSSTLVVAWISLVR